MKLRRTLATLEGVLATAAGSLAAPFAFATRLYVGWVFLKSGWLKVNDWAQTLSLFETEYHVPLLPPHLAAYAGATGELLFGALVVAGLAGRASALGLFAVNLLAFVSYRHVLLQDGFEAAVGQHQLWAFMLAVVAVYGPGRWSLDGLLGGRGGAGARA